LTKTIFNSVSEFYLQHSEITNI